MEKGRGQRLNLFMSIRTNIIEVMKMKVAAIVGSICKESYNMKLARYIQNRYKYFFQLEVLNIREILFYDQDIKAALPQSVIDFKAKVAATDAVLWVTPEYNSTIPGVMVNAIDWLSHVDRVMIRRPLWIVGSSIGLVGSIKRAIFAIFRSRREFPHHFCQEMKCKWAWLIKSLMGRVS